MADTLAGALAEQDPHARLHVLRMADEAEQHRRTVIGADVLAAHDALDDGRLPDAADVHGGLEALADGGRMEQHRHLGLAIGWEGILCKIYW